MPLKRKMLHCSASVKKGAVRRETVDGVEHVIVSSYTLKDDSVMNGGYYSAEEIEKSYHTLENTLSPIGHPVDKEGTFLLAADPIAINNFYAGAWNKNVTRKDGRVHIEQWINVQEAMKSERGKRLMDRIVELETNDKARPIHTSTGLLLSVEQLEEPMTNADGEEYTWIGRDFVFDHNAILLDSLGAATPEQGVGLAVNSYGQEIEVETFVFNEDNDNQSNTEGMGSNELREQLELALKGIVAYEWMYIADIYDDVVIFETNQGYFEVPYRVDNDVATVVGIPIRVEKDVTYTPKTNEEKGDVMKDIIINALKGAGIETKDLDDKALFEAYNKMKEPEADSEKTIVDPTEAIIAAVNAAVKPLTDKVEALQTALNSKGAEEIETLSKVVGDSDKFPGLTTNSAKLIAVEELREMAAACGHSVGVPLSFNMDGEDKAYSVETEMPE